MSEFQTAPGFSFGSDAPSTTASPYVTPYVKRKINVTFQVATGNFQNGNYNTIRLGGRRVSADITVAGNPSTASLNMRIWGLSLSTMNSLTVVGYDQVKNRGNLVTVEAGDDVSGMWTVFNQGTIVGAYMDGNAQPEVAFVVQSNVAQFQALQPAKPLSIQGQTTVANELEKLAKAMGYQFENNNVTAALNDTYIPGTPLEQVRALVEHAHIDMHLDEQTHTLAIWPKGQSRSNSGNAVPLLSKDTGMQDYPTFTQNGISVSATYNPAFRFGMYVRIKSQIPAASGLWIIDGMSHTLESEVPGGRWMTVMSGHSPGSEAATGAEAQNQG